MTAPDDDALVAELSDLAARTDPPPRPLVEAARSALALRRADRELAALAELSHDSADDELVLFGVRSDAGPRLLTFAAGDVSIEVEVAATSGDRQVSLVGQLVPPQPGRIEVRHADGETVVEADEVGRFRCEQLTRGPVSLRCHLGAGDQPAVVVTDWLAL